MAARVLTIGALAALAAAGVAAYLRFSVADGAPPPSAIRIEIGGEKLAFPTAYLASEAGDPPQMAAFLPDFRAAGGGGDIDVKTDLDQRFQRIVFLRPVAADPTLDPAERTARLYERFLAFPVLSAPDGLAARAFTEDSPFRGDQLFYVPPEGREFAARCRSGSGSATPNVCVSVFRAGRLDVEVRFPRQWLPQWREILQGAHGLLEAWRS